MQKEVNFKLDSNLIYLVEALKVEGYWSLKGREGSIQNKNLPLLRRLEEIFNKFNIKVGKRILIKIKLDAPFLNDEIKIKFNSKEINFHIEKSPFDGSKKIVFVLPFEKEYKIYVKINKKSSLIKIKEGEEEFEIESPFRCWAYREIRFWKVNFIRFLDNYCNDRKDLHVNIELFKNKDYFINLLGALIDCEGSLANYKMNRIINIRMRSLGYLKDIKTLLDFYDINNYLRTNYKKDYIEYQLIIRGWETFNKLICLGLKFYHSKKIKRFDAIMKSFKIHQVLNAKSFYLKSLKEINEPIIVSDLAIRLNKSYRVVNHYLNKLIKENLINVDKSNIYYLYSYKKENDMYLN